MATHPFAAALDRSRAACRDRLAILKTLEIIYERRRGCIASRRIFAKGLQANRLQIARYFAVQARRRNRVLMNELPLGVARSLAAERWAAREHFVHDRAERINVGSRTDGTRFAQCLLRRHVARRSNSRPCERQILIGLEVQGKSEIANLRYTIGRQKDI